METKLPVDDNILNKPAQYLDHSQFLQSRDYIGTNNYCEGYHKRLAQRIRYPRSRLTSLLDVFKIELEFYQERSLANFKGESQVEQVDRNFISNTKLIIK